MVRDNFKRKAVATAVAMTISMSPLVARADTVYVSNMFQAVQAVASAASSISSAIGASTTSIVQAILALSSQNQANAERQNVINKTLAEATQNYDKQYRLQEHTAAINREYGSSDPNSVTQSAACEAIAVGGNLASAIQDKREAKQALAGTMLQRNTTTADPISIARNTLKVHSENFCSQDDVARGRCAKVAPVALQSADLKASNLFEPNDTYTYGEKEELAAEEYIHNLVSASPTPALSRRAEQTPAGQAYLAAQYAEQRRLDIAANSLREIFASRKEEPGLGTRVNMNTPNASVMGVISHYAGKFLDPDWMVSLGQMNAIDHQREQTRMMAFNVWLDYQTYLQGERTEAILATQMIDQVKSSRSPELASLRARALTMNNASR